MKLRARGKKLLAQGTPLLHMERPHLLKSQTRGEKVEERTNQVLLCTAYVAYGRAMRAAQDLEGSVKLLLASMSEQDGLVRSMSDYLDDMEEHSKPTLGRLIVDLRKRLTLPDAMAELLAAALATRNHLAHKYLVHRLPQWWLDSGLESMIQELLEYTQTLQNASSAVSIVRQGLFSDDEEERAEMEHYFKRL